MAEGRWEEIVEKTLLPAEGFWHLLRSQRKSQGVCLFTGREAWGYASFQCVIDFQQKVPLESHLPLDPNCYHILYCY